MSDTVEPLTPLECPYCLLVKESKTHPEVFAYEDERVALILRKTESGIHKQGVVITKQHYNGLSASTSEDIWKAMDLSRKCSHSLWVERPSIKGIKYESAQGSGSGANVEHFYITITPV